MLIFQAKNCKTNFDTLVRKKCIKIAKNKLTKSSVKFCISITNNFKTTIFLDDVHFCKLNAFAQRVSHFKNDL